jgi:hypothetical protein
MFLVHCKTHDMVEILDPQALFDSSQRCVKGCYHAGEELQDAQLFDKCDLFFPSGESLPECWTNKHFTNNRFCEPVNLKAA